MRTSHKCTGVMWSEKKCSTTKECQVTHWNHGQSRKEQCHNASKSMWCKMGTRRQICTHASTCWIRILNQLKSPLMVGYYGQTHIKSTDGTQTLFIDDEILVKLEANLLLNGWSNCRCAEITDDDDININVATLVQRGLIIKKAPEKLDECSKEIKENADAFIELVGSCNFPMNDYPEIDQH